MTRHPILLALLCASLVLPAAGDLPDLGDSALGNLPAHEEKRIAEMTLRELRRSGMVLDDAEVDDYLQRLGYKLVGASDDNRVNFRFFPIDDKSINAWAVPGGVIGINLGLVVLSQHESELAAVVAHEIAHVTQHHYARMVESQKGAGIVSLGALALAILAASRSSGDAPIAAMAASEGYQIQRYLDFSRDLEREADRVGIQTLAKAGFDTRAMPAFFDRMQKYYRNVDNGAFAFLRTHPVTLERISDSEARAAQQPYKQLADSTDYLLVREKLRVRQLGRYAALDYYRGTTEQRKYASELAQQYGYAYALYLDTQYDAAAARLEQARKRQPAGGHPMLEGLAAQILVGQGRFDDATVLLAKAMERYPSALSLRYAEIDLLIQRGLFKDAEARLDQALTERPGDPALHKRLAQSYQLQGKTGAYHRAMAEYYGLIDEPAPAIEQLNLARRQGGDYYLLSAIEARIRDMRARLPVDKKGKPIIPTPDVP